MSAQMPDNRDPLQPECAAALDVLQRRLDGEIVAAPPAVAAHVAACADCRGRFAAIGPLLAALDGSEPQMRPLLTQQIVAGVLADIRRRRQVRRLSFAAAGLAAGVAFTLWLARPPAPITPTPLLPEVVQRTPVPNLKQEFTEAGEAVAALTRRAAVDAVDAGRQLVPAVPQPQWLASLEPARSFDEAGTGLADGFEPVATSARRAARLFWRELSMSDEKQD
jgi:hypothetical protein